MGKVRVYELAKELNTTSKRLMEKLAEINVVVKNHMSLLEENELEALYKHIGVIRHDEKAEVEEKKAAPVAPPPRPESKKDAKNTPRIIRTTEIIINSKSDEKEVQQPSRNGYRRGDNRGPRNDVRRDFVRSSDANSGLRAGFVRDNRADLLKELTRIKKDQRKSVQDQNIKKEAAKPESVETAKPAVTAAGTEAVASGRSGAPLISAEKAGKETQKEVQTKSAGKAAAKKEEKVRARDDAAKPADMQTAEAKAEAVKAVEAKAAEAKAGDEKAADIKTADVKAADVKTADVKAADVKAAEVKIAEAKTTDAIKTENEKKAEKPQQEKQNQQPTIAGETAGKPADGGLQPEKAHAVRRHDEDAQATERHAEEKQHSYGSRGKAEKNQHHGDRRPDEKSQYQSERPQGDRPRYQSGRSQDDRPRYQSGRSQDDRSRDQGGRPQGDRSRDQSGRPQGDRPRYQGGRPQGDRPQYHGGRAQGGAGFHSGSKPLEIPKPDPAVAQKEEPGFQRSEIRREFGSKDFDKDNRREQKKETVKTQPQVRGGKRVKPVNIGLSEKKGVSEILSEDFLFNDFYNETDAKKKKQNKGRKVREIRPKHIPPRAVLTSIKIPESITVKDLAETLKKTSAEVIKKLMGYGVMAVLNQEIDFDTAVVIADEFGVKAEKEIVVNEEDILFDDKEDEEPGKLVPRPPVVVVMGHVDHGKTSLLDAIRSTHVIDDEAGGITQHIGAYMVKVKNGRTITFLDTPGHEAFTAMRARGAQVTDIAILVVAADDGVMPQTIEAINHAKAAKVSIIVAINKIDKPGANPDKVKQELAQHGLVSEEWGGDVICVNVSAKKRQNIDQLLEMVLLTADVLELKANPHRQAKGTVIESKLDKNRGPLATVLVQRGTLNVGDSIVTGITVGRIRAMSDDMGNSVKSAGPSTPVEILGLPEVPEAGELFYAIQDEKIARHLAEKRKFKQKEEKMHETPKVSLDDLFKQIQEGQVKDLNIIVKADVQGSVEAVEQSLAKLSNDEVRVNIIHGAVGAITETDVTLASVSNAIIIGFNVRPGANVAEAAENAGVDVRLYRIIYNAIEDIEAAMKGMLEPKFKEVVLGHTEVRQIFKVSGIGTIAGCYVVDGKISRNSDVRIVRDGIVIHEGSLASLKRFKDDAKEVLQGFECGLSIERFNDIKEGDVIEAYTNEEVKQ